MRLMDEYIGADNKSHLWVWTSEKDLFLKKCDKRVSILQEGHSFCSSMPQRGELKFADHTWAFVPSSKSMASRQRRVSSEASRGIFAGQTVTVPSKGVRCAKPSLTASRGAKSSEHWITLADSGNTSLANCTTLQILVLYNQLAKVSSMHFSLATQCAIWPRIWSILNFLALETRAQDMVQKEAY